VRGKGGEKVRKEKRSHRYYLGGEKKGRGKGVFLLYFEKEKKRKRSRGEEGGKPSLIGERKKKGKVGL